MRAKLKRYNVFKVRAACQNEEGVITTYATIRYANHIHELIIAWDGHNDRLQFHDCTVLLLE